jgi:hypothetical protein
MDMNDKAKRKWKWYTTSNNSPRLDAVIKPTRALNSSSLRQSFETVPHNMETKKNKEIKEP